MAAFLSLVPVRDYVSVRATVPAVRELVFTLVDDQPAVRCRPVRRWNRAPDGRLVCHWQHEAVKASPPH